MKPTLAFVFFLACSGIVLASQTSPATYTGKRASLLEELVQMTRAGSSDVELLAYAKAHRRELPPEVSDQDLQFLRDSGVSERVVSYMTAIDARIPSDAGQEGAAFPDQAVPPPATDPYAYPPNEGGAYGNGDLNGNVSSYPDSYAYSDTYGDGRCGSQWGYDCYPYFNSYYPYPYYYYPYTFFAFQPFHRFHDHVHHFRDGHGSDGNRWRGKSAGAMTNARVARGNDAWRQRSFNGYNASMRRPAALGQRGPARTVPTRQGMGSRPGAASRMLASRGFGSSGPARGSLAGVPRAPQANFGNRGSFSRPTFSGGMRGSASVGHPSFSGGGMHAGGGARGGGGRH